MFKYPKFYEPEIKKDELTIPLEKNTVKYYESAKGMTVNLRSPQDKSERDFKLPP